MYFASQHPMAASAIATLREASSRAFSMSERLLGAASSPWSESEPPPPSWRPVMSDTAARFHKNGAVLRAQNHAAFVWSAVREALVRLPIVFVSLKSFVYWSLVSAGGPAGRNCDGGSIAHGVISENCL